MSRKSPCRTVILSGAIFLLSGLQAGSGGDPRPVGIVDHRLVWQENWVKPWKEAWRSEAVAELFRRHGVEALVIGLDDLRDLEKLKALRAILIPADECYPDEGAKDGPLSKNLAAYVRAGGIYILPMGASHCRWRDVKTGAVGTGSGGGERDFLGLEWLIVGDHANPGPALALTAAGEKAGIPKPAFSTPLSTYARAAAEAAEVYAANQAGKPCLYAVDVGKGLAIHYAGGLPLGPEVRDWLVAAYAGILKSGPNVAAIRSARLRKSRVYDLIPAAPRAEGEPPGAGRQITLSGEWELAEAAGDPSASVEEATGARWTAVPMPGTIQYALFRAGKIDNPWYSDNYKKLQWIHQRDWLLRRRFRVPEEWRGRRLRLRFDGLDYLGMVWLDGAFLGTHEGMFGGPTFDVSALAIPGAEHELLVRLIHETGPQTGPAQVIKSMAVDGTSYQWGNRFRTIGLWRPVRLIATGKAYLEAPVVRTEAVSAEAASASAAELWAQAMVLNAGLQFEGAVRARILDLAAQRVIWEEEARQLVPSGNSFWERSIRLREPKLWWPNGLGGQPLYRLELALMSSGEELDAIGARFGIRTLELRRNPSPPQSPRSASSHWPGGEPLAGEAMALADESHRFLFAANGRPFYAKGGCWLTSDDLLALTPEREGWLIRAARLAGLNLFRLNGGCNLFETEQFYDLCDENGILVWQELPLCWNSSHGSPLAAWRDQLTQTVLRLRRHPSLAVYVGGNEFQPYASGIWPAVALWRELCSAYDNRPFRMSSPGGGTHHAYSPWEMYGADPNWYARLVHEGYGFVSEWSFPAFANLSLLKRVVPKEELESGPVGRDWKRFMAAHPVLHDRHSEVDFIGLFSYNSGSWYGDLARAEVGPFVEYSQMAQAHVYGSVFEAWRSQFPFKGGQTVWVYNSIAPVSSWNLIDWFGQPLASYYAAKRSHEPVHIMARTDFFSWGPGDAFRAAVFALNDGAPIADARLTARILDPALKPVVNEAWPLSLPGGGEKSAASEVSWAIPADLAEGYFFLELTLADGAGKRLSRQAYWLRVLKSLAGPEARRRWQSVPVPEPLAEAGPWLKPQLESVSTSLQARAAWREVSPAEAEVAVTVANTGSHPAWPVRLETSPDLYPVLWTDNYFWLAEGESVAVKGLVRMDLRGIDPTANPPAARLQDLTAQVSAWNARAVQLSPAN